MVNKSAAPPTPCLIHTTGPFCICREVYTLRLRARTTRRRSGQVNLSLNHGRPLIFEVSLTAAVNQQRDSQLLRQLVVPPGSQLEGTDRDEWREVKTVTPPDPPVLPRPPVHPLHMKRVAKSKSASRCLSDSFHLRGNEWRGTPR